MRLKILTIILTLCCISLYAQNEKITLQIKNEPLGEALKKIESKSGYTFVYSEFLPIDMKVSLDCIEMPLKLVLEHIFKDRIIYKINGKNIALTPIDIAPTEGDRIFSVKGIIVDDADLPVEGVAIIIKESGKYAFTDAEGKYSIDAKKGDVMELVAIGYVKTRRSVHGTNDINIKLENDVTVLEDVVVTGYQTLSKERATGSYSMITSAKLGNKLNSSVQGAIEGQLAGVYVDKKGDLSIRGISTFNATRTPLLVVDGFPVETSISDLNPDNIENITVLKDGVSASIYGSRSANGVIVVTTKRGKNGKKPLISYKGSFSFSAKPNTDDLNYGSTSDFIDSEIEYFNMNPALFLPNPLLQRTMSPVSKLLRDAYSEKITQAEADARINEYRNVDGLSQIEEYLFRPELKHNHTISISGGSSNNTYNTALNYSGGKDSYVHTNNSKIIFDLNNNWNPLYFLTVDMTANVTYSKNQTPVSSYGSMLGYSSKADLSSTLLPYSSLVNPDGSLVEDMGTYNDFRAATYATIPGMLDWKYNPISDLSKETNRNENFSTRLGLNLKFRIMEGLNLQLGGSWQYGYNINKTYYAEDSFIARTAYNDATSKKNNNNHYIPLGGIVEETRGLNQSLIGRAQLNYNNSFGKHRLNLLAGSEIKQLSSDINNVGTRVGYNEIAGTFVPLDYKSYSSNYSDMLFCLLNILPTYAINSGSYSKADHRFVSWYFNGSYEYDNRYLVSGSVRMDLTNFFGTDPKYRYRPLWSIGGTWKISNEKFFDVDWVNMLNLRASYGINGNISLNHGPFLILSTGSYSSQTEGIPYTIQSAPSNQLTWEKTKTVNIGIDFALLQNRLAFSIDGYEKLSTDLLSEVPADITTGMGKLVQNAGRIRNRGIEISINGTPVKTDKFSWDLGLTAAYNNSKVLEYEYNYSNPVFLTTDNIKREGYPLNAIFEIPFAGLNEKGEPMMYNSKGEKALMSGVQIEDFKFAGSSIPKYNLSFNTSFQYSNWSLSMLFIANLGHKYIKPGFYGDTSSATNEHFSERWKKAGDEQNTIYPAYTPFDTKTPFFYKFNDQMIGNAGYLKLRDITLSYSFKENLLKKIGFSSAKVYAQARNLFTITEKGCKIDPETILPNGYTVMKYGFKIRPEYFLGLSFSF